MGKNGQDGAVVVVKWSACSPSTSTIRVQIPLKPTPFFSVKLFGFEKNKNSPVKKLTGFELGSLPASLQPLPKQN